MLFKISSKLLLSISSLGVSKSVKGKERQSEGGKACISTIRSED